MTDPVSMINTDLPDLVEWREVNQTYFDRQGKPTVVIDRFNLLIEDLPDQGQFEVICGPSGCGKSTVLRHLAGLQKLTSGEVLIQGKPRTDEDHVPMVFQRMTTLEYMTVLGNVEMPLEIQGVPAKERRERAREMLNRLGIGATEKRWAKDPFLSGGQLQRVQIARSLIANPHILLMDEPFYALDAVTRYEMQELLQKVWMETQSSVIFVTHSISEAVFLAQRIHIMSTRPGMIMKSIHVDFPFPRTQEMTHDPRFLELQAEVMTTLRGLSLEIKA